MKKKIIFGSFLSALFLSLIGSEKKNFFITPTLKRSTKLPSHDEVWVPTPTQTILNQTRIPTKEKSTKVKQLSKTRGFDDKFLTEENLQLKKGALSPQKSTVPEQK